MSTARRVAPETVERVRALLDDPRTVAFVHSIDDLRARGVVIDGDVPHASLAGRVLSIRESPAFVERGTLVLAAMPDRLFVGDPAQLAGALRVGVSR